MTASTSLSRVVRLIRRAIDELDLDLSGARVLTEAGSGPYAATPAIAAAAGAERVDAVTGDSQFAPATEVEREVAALVGALDVAPDRVRVHRSRTAVTRGVDIVTNLGFVRPVDEGLLEKLSRHGVVSLMAESWEIRPEDVDLSACRRMGVPAAGLFEDFRGLNVFASCGPLAVKLCFEAGLEVAGNALVLLGAGRFADVVRLALEANLAHVRQVASASELDEAAIAAVDGLLVVDYHASHAVLGGDVGPSGAQLAAWNPALRIVQFTGVTDVRALTVAGLAVWPPHRLRPRRMARTLDHLGPRPVVFLHAAGLKVGELLWREAREGVQYGEYTPLVQRA
jgi:hypothetical protein